MTNCNIFDLMIVLTILCIGGMSPIVSIIRFEVVVTQSGPRTIFDLEFCNQHISMNIEIKSINFFSFSRWVNATDWETELQCDGNEVAVGSCSGGGGLGHKDCPGETVHQLQCCLLPDYSFSSCNTWSSDFGVPIDCRDHGDQVLEGQCHSGVNQDCQGAANLVTCCEGTYQGQAVGPVESECTWEYSGHGTLLECGRSDEVLVGRCGSGKTLDCPGGTSQGNLCCKLDFLQMQTTTTEA